LIQKDEKCFFVPKCRGQIDEGNLKKLEILDLLFILIGLWALLNLGLVFLGRLCRPKKIKPKLRNPEWWGEKVTI
jgi:hypothetical protein